MLGARAVAWLESDVDEWIESRIAESRDVAPMVSVWASREERTQGPASLATEVSKRPPICAGWGPGCAPNFAQNYKHIGRELLNWRDAHLCAFF